VIKMKFKRIDTLSYAIYDYKVFEIYGWLIECDEHTFGSENPPEDNLLVEPNKSTLITCPKCGQEGKVKVSLTIETEGR